MKRTALPKIVVAADGRGVVGHAGARLLAQDSSVPGCNHRWRRFVLVGVTPSEEQDFTEFVRAYGDRLLRFARLLVPDAAEAEDVLQTALLRLTRHWCNQVDAPAAYVRATLVNLAKDRRRRKHLVPVPTDIQADQQLDGPDHAEAYAARAHLDEVLATLPPRQRVTVVLRVIEGLSESETAAIMRCSPGTVKSNLARGLDKVRGLLRPTATVKPSALESSATLTEENAR